MDRNNASNRQKPERAEAERVSIARRSTIPGMITHRWNSVFYADAMWAAASKRKVR